MKKFFVAIAFSAIASIAGAQQSLEAVRNQVHDANHNIKGYINRDGSVQDQNKRTLCSFQQNGTIVDAKANPIGYIINETELQDKNHKTVAYITREGNIENEKHERIGHIDNSGSGPVTDHRNTTIGYITKIEPMWAAAYFFLLKY